MKYYFIGLTATGNRTAGKAMSLLGYSWIHYPSSIDAIDRAQALTDTSVALWFRQEKLPKDGVYILTTRDLNSWLDDCKTWFESRPFSSLKPIDREIREYLFNGITFDRDRFISAYEQHYNDCHKIAEKMNVVIHEWNVTANPSWEFLFELTNRTSCEKFPFNPGIYHETWIDVVSAENKSFSQFI